MTTSLYKKGMVLGIIFLFVGAGVVSSIAGNENKQNMENSSGENILGTIKITHSTPMDLNVFMEVEFIPVEDKEFYFPEVDGKVELNFTVICEHDLYSDSGIFTRKSKIRVDVDDIKEHIMYAHGEGTYNCESTEIELNNLSVEMTKLLVTNGEPKELYVGLYAKIMIGQFEWPPLMIWRGAIILPIIGDLLADENSYFPITINPTQ